MESNEYTVTFLEVAQIELDEAVAYYNYEIDGLGYSFFRRTTSCTEQNTLFSRGMASLF
jgi:hypothetical protein